MMMTISSNPTVQVPPWDCYLEDPTANIHSPFSLSPNDDLTALHRYLPSNMADDVEDEGDDTDFPVDAYSCDDFRMYEFKVKRCARDRSHDWTECPYAHPGEKARRRDPRKFHYSGNPCPEFRKGQCKKGDGCEYAHGVFECWLHPSRYRTQPCKDGTLCRRRVCFFAHTPDQLRVLPTGNSPRNNVVSESYDGSPNRLALDSPSRLVGLDSHRRLASASTLYLQPCSPQSESPPMSPVGSLSELASSIRNLQIGSPRSGFPMLRPGFMSTPTTPTRNSQNRPGLKVFDLWDKGGRGCYEEEPVMERVESGKEVRAKIYAKLSRENSLSLARNVSSGQCPDFGWVSDLVK